MKGRKVDVDLRGVYALPRSMRGLVLLPVLAALVDGFDDEPIRFYAFGAPNGHMHWWSIVGAR